MKPRIFLVALSLAILFFLSLFSLKNNFADGQNQGKQSGDQQTQTITQISDKLDKILDTQQRILDRLGAVENSVIHEVRIRATH